MRALLVLLLLVSPLASDAQAGGKQFHLSMEFVVAGEERLPFEVVMGELDFADMYLANPDLPDDGQRVLVRTTGWDDEREVLTLRVRYLEQAAGKWQVVEEPRMGVGLGEVGTVRLELNDVVQFSVSVNVSLVTGGLEENISGCEHSEEHQRGMLIGTSLTATASARMATSFMVRMVPPVQIGSAVSPKAGEATRPPRTVSSARAGAICMGSLLPCRAN